jgi:hemerythrin-like domain-containing protein
MKATEFLEKQHRKVEQLLTKLENGRADATATIEELAKDLAGHMAIEQEIFYPAARQIAPEIVAECFEEHAIAELALNRLIHTEPGSGDIFHARVKSLKELVMHHVSEEERELLPQIDEKMSDEDSAALLKQMKARFAEVTQAGYEAMLPKTPSRTTADKKPPKRTPSVRPPAH